MERRMEIWREARGLRDHPLSFTSLSLLS